jgi:pyridoxine kinase
VLAHHPGHGAFRGRVCAPDEVAELVAGLDAIGALATVDMVATGYLGDPGTAAVAADLIGRFRRANPRGRVLVDPVIGDHQPDGTARAFVRPGVAEALREQLAPLADIVTPNRFELGVLTGRPVEDRAALIAAARSLAPATVVVTGVDLAPTPADCLDLLVVGDGAVHCVATPRLARRFDGPGDLFSGLLAGALLAGAVPLAAVARAAAAMTPVLRATGDGRDLDLAALVAPVEVRPARAEV